jgi:hypothetical protein
MPALERGGGYSLAAASFFLLGVKKIFSKTGWRYSV